MIISNQFSYLTQLTQFEVRITMKSKNLLYYIYYCTTGAGVVVESLRHNANTRRSMPYISGRIADMTARCGLGLDCSL